MRIIMILLYMIVIIWTPITIICSIVNKLKHRSVSKQLRNFIIQGIMFVTSFLLFLACTYNEISNDVVDEIPTNTPTPTVYVESQEEYKNSCQEYSYKDVLRNPEEYLGKRVKVKLKINSVHEKGLFNPQKYYLAYSEGEYGWYGNLYGVFDLRDETEFKILSEDIIVVYGEIISPKYTSSIVLSSEEIFCMEMKYADLIKE